LLCKLIRGHSVRSKLGPSSLCDWEVSFWPIDSREPLLSPAPRLLLDYIFFQCPLFGGFFCFGYLSGQSHGSFLPVWVWWLVCLSTDNLRILWRPDSESFRVWVIFVHCSVDSSVSGICQVKVMATSSRSGFGGQSVFRPTTRGYCAVSSVEVRIGFWLGDSQIFRLYSPNSKITRQLVWIFSPT
jgi:hypothetical protein